MTSNEQRPERASRVEELPESTCWALVRGVPFGRVALQGASDIEVFPVNFVVDGASLVFRTGQGTKLSLIDHGARCTFEADDIGVVGEHVGDGDERSVWSVVMKGTVRPVSDRDAVIAIFDLDVTTWQEGAKPVYVRISPDVISGRRFPIEST